MLTSYLILFGLGILFAWPIFNLSPAEIISAIEERNAQDHIELMKFLQVLYSIGLFLIPALLAGFMIRKDAWDFLKADHRPKFTISILVLLLLVVSIPWINYLGYLNEQLFKQR